MTNKTLLKNDLITLAWINGRLDILDTDGNFIDYLYYETDDVTTEDLGDAYKTADYLADMLSCMEEKELCQWMKIMFDIFKVEPYCGDEETMTMLREQWGDEWVVRIGNTALIIEEK